jgi:hypothetical protein
MVAGGDAGASAESPAWDGTDAWAGTVAMATVMAAIVAATANIREVRIIKC